MHARVRVRAGVAVRARCRGGVRYTSALCFIMLVAFMALVLWAANHEAKAASHKSPPPSPSLPRPSPAPAHARTEIVHVCAGTAQPKLTDSAQ